MSVFTTTSGATGLLALFQSELVRPFDQASIAARVSTTLRTDSARIEVPVITEDADAGWYAEGAEIATDDPAFNTITVVPRKLAGLTAISNETIMSANRNAVSMGLDSLVRDIATKLDAAYFGNLAAPAPAGLGALVGVTALTTDLTTLDVFDEARIEATKLGESIGSFVTDPDTLLSLATAKESTTSRRPLLQPAVSESAVRERDAVTLTVSGVPVYASPAVEPGIIWGIPKRTSILVVSGEPDVASSSDAGFKNDLTYVRATLRVGFAFTRPAAIAKVTVETV
jgi:HK97 family phage major capsid protein